MRELSPTSYPRTERPAARAATRRSSIAGFAGTGSSRAIPPWTVLAAVFSLLATFLAPLPVAASPADAADPGPGVQDAVTHNAEPGAPVPGVAGQVRGDTRPLEAVRVYAYHLRNLKLEKVETDGAGRFLFQHLPAGLYKVIAHKAGFVPAVVQITRAAADSYQFLDLELAEERADRGEANDFWAVRARIPADVLRQIAIQQARAGEGSGLTLAGTALTRDLKPDDLRFAAEMSATTGVDQIAVREPGQMVSGSLGVRGQVGDLRMSLTGDYRQLQTEALATTAAQASALSLNLASAGHTEVTVRSLTNRQEPTRRSDEPVDFELYRVSVSQNHGSNGRSELSAQYTDESNFYRQGSTDPLGIPEASRIFQLSGSYATSIGEGTQIEAGMRYWQRDYDTPVADGAGHLYQPPGEERVDVFSRGDTRLQPTVLVEYGLFTTLTDGSLSLAPRGGVVLKLGESWQAAASVSHRLQRGTALTDFLPTLYNPRGDCGLNEEYCYRVLFTRDGEEDQRLSFGAMHRQFAETLRLYFSEDFFDHLENLYLVPGDELPEVQLAWTRRLSPKVLARLESNLAAGGGGIFYATDREPYENEVRYLVTSLDTRFQETSTGLFIAFHHLQQQLNALSGPELGPDPMELERLQLMLTQDLNVLLDLTQHWAVHLNMELSRGSDPFSQVEDDEELRKRILGGIAIKF